MPGGLAERVRIREDRVFTSRRLAVYSAVLVFVYALVLALGIGHGVWVETRAGVPIANDFLPMWLAGREVLTHGAAAAYDWPTMLAAEREITQGAFTEFYAWPYPPTFFFAAVPVALLPYTAAFAAWMTAIVAAYLATIYAIVPRWATPVVALASPTVFWGVAIGQNSPLTAALLGGSLAFVETRPVLAGILLGLLTYKPHFGVLFPLVLVLTGNWRVIAAATTTALALAFASYIAFGAEAWAQFAANLPRFGDSVLNSNAIGWQKLQSVYGLLRWLGAGGVVAWSGHIAFAIMTAAAVALVWLRPLPYALKAALLSLGALIVTPYVFLYDLTMLGVPIAFLVSEGLSSGFLRGERTVLVAFVAACLVALPFGHFRGLIEILAVAGFVILRVLHAERHPRVRRRLLRAEPA